MTDRPTAFQNLFARRTGFSFFLGLIYTFLIAERGGYQVSQAASDTGGGCCAYFLIALSWLLMILTFPFSLCAAIKVNVKSIVGAP